MPLKRVAQRLRGDAELRSVFADSGVLYAAGAVALVLTVAQQLTTARFLGAIEYGRLAAALGATLLLFLFVDIRTWELGMRLLTEPLHLREYDEAASRFTWLLGAELLCGLIGTLSLVSLAPLLAGSYLDDDSRSLFFALALLIPLRQVNLGVSVAMLRLLGKYRLIAMRSAATSFTRFTAIAGPAMLGWGTAAVALGMAVAELIAAVSIIGLAMSSYRARSGRSLLRRSGPDCVPEAFRLAKILWISASIKALHIESFIPVAAAFTSPGQIGTLRTGLDIGQVASQATAPISMVMSPKIVTSARVESREQLAARVKLAVRVFGAIVFPVAICGGLAIHFVLPRLLGSGYPSIRPVSLLLLTAMAFSALTQWVRPLLVGLDRVREQNRVGAVAGLCSLLALPILVSQYGAVGAAADMVAFIGVYNVLGIRIAKRALDEQI